MKPWILIAGVCLVSLAVNAVLLIDRRRMEEEIASLTEQADTLEAARLADAQALKIQKKLTEEAREYAQKQYGILDNLENSCTPLTDNELRSALVRMLLQGGEGTDIPATGNAGAAGSSSAAQ